MITSSIEIDRPPAEVFAYVEQLDRHGEWQPAILAARKEPEGPTRLGTRNIETRRVPGGPREFVSEIFEYEPSRRIAARSVGGGPISATVTITIEPLAGGARSSFTLQLDLVGHGLGKIFVLLARRDARRRVPEDQKLLKALLEKRPG